MIKIIAFIIGLVLGTVAGLLEKSESTFMVEDEEGNMVYKYKRQEIK